MEPEEFDEQVAAALESVPPELGDAMSNVEIVVEEEPPLERPTVAVTPRVVTSEPVALQSRPLTVPKKRVNWLAPAIRRLAARRDTKLGSEVVIALGNDEEPYRVLSWQDDLEAGRHPRKSVGL